jgi:hypothetical protein
LEASEHTFIKPIRKKKSLTHNFLSPSVEAHKGREVQGEASREMLAASVM